MIQNLKRFLIVLFLLFPVICHLSPALHAQQPTSDAGLFVANSAYLQGRTWADLKCTPGTALLPPLAPTLSQVAGGTLGARTYYVKITYKNLGGETTASGQSALAISANYLLYVTSPVASGNATHYNVYASTVSGSETKQNTNPVLIGADWTEPVSGLISGAALPTANTTALYVDTAPGIAVVNGVRYPFPSVISTAVSPSVTTYFFLSTSGALSSNNTGYLAGSIPLAKAVSNTTVVSSVDDDRSLLNGVNAPGGFTPGYQPTAGAGLTLNLAAGTAYCGDPPVPVFYAGGTLALTASHTNYVYLDPAATCVPAFNITGFAVGQIPLAKVVTGTSAITSVTDVRTWFAPLPCVTSSTGVVTCTATSGTYTVGTDGTAALYLRTVGVNRWYVSQGGHFSANSDGVYDIGTSGAVRPRNYFGAGKIVAAKAVISGVNTVTFSATPTFDASLGNTQKITLTANVTSSTLSNASTGQTINFIICQDATGGRTFVWPTNVKGAPTVASTASVCTGYGTTYDGTNALGNDRDTAGMIGDLANLAGGVARANSYDFTPASVTRPLRRLPFASFPGTCTALTDFLARSDPATAGQVVYVCNAAGTGWDLVGDGGGTIDQTVATFSEDFLSSGTATNTLGANGWTIRNIGAAPSVAYVAATWPHLGQLRITTPAVIAQGGEIAIDSSSVAQFGALGSNAGWDTTIIFRLPTGNTTNIRVRCGFRLGTANGVAEPTDGIWIRYDTSAGFADAYFTFETRNASVSTTSIVNSIAADTSFHRFRIRSTTAGTVLFSVDGGTETAINTNVPTVGLTAFFNIVSDLDATAKSIDVDLFSWKATGLAR